MSSQKCSASLLKTLWEKDKLLVTSNLSFSYSVFYLLGKLSAIFCHLQALSVWKSLKFVWERVNSLSNNKLLDWSKLKAFTDNKINVTKELKFVSGRVETLVGKGKNAGHQHFFLFPQCFQEDSFTQTCAKCRDCLVKG